MGLECCSIFSYGLLVIIVMCFVNKFKEKKRKDAVKQVNSLIVVKGINKGF